MQLKAAWKKRIQGGLTLVLFGGALWWLRGELRKYPVHDIGKELGRYSILHLCAVAGITLFCYLLLSGYDYLGFRYLRHRIAAWHVILTAFVAFAFGNNIGMANFAGAAVRYRLYSGFGVRGEVVAEVVALNVLSNWLGFLLTVGIIFVISDPALPPHWKLPIGHAAPLGYVFLLLVGVYFFFAELKKKPIRIGRWSIPVPHNRVFFLQVLVGCSDFLSGAVILYLLMPSPMPFSFWPYLGSYMLAQFAGILSHVPGGLGVFEGMMLLLFTPEIPGAAMISSLIAFRAIYFFLPLFLALPLLLGFEIWHRIEPARS